MTKQEVLEKDAYIAHLEQELADMTTAATGLSDDLTRLGEQLAESQAREEQMREALLHCDGFLRGMDSLGFHGLAITEVSGQALALPTDDTALRQALAKELRAMAEVLARTHDEGVDITHAGRLLRRANELENQK